MTNWPDLELPPINLWNAPKGSDVPKPDNLVALHHQMTGSYVVDAPKLVSQRRKERVLLSSRHRSRQTPRMEASAFSHRRPWRMRTPSASSRCSRRRS